MLNLLMLKYPDIRKHQISFWKQLPTSNLNTWAECIPNTLWSVWETFCESSVSEWKVLFCK